MEMGLTDQLSVQLQGTGQAINGDADNYNLILKDKLEFELDLANITYKNISGAPLSITLGRQDLKFGDGFLIYDGYYDTVALWLTPVSRQMNVDQSCKFLRDTYLPEGVFL
jgi:hypothetical protein